MLYYVIFLLGTTAHAHQCITKFVSISTRSAAADRPLCETYIRTAHKLAADSTGASHRLVPVLDPNHVSGQIFFCKQTLWPAIMLVLNVLHRPDDDSLDVEVFVNFAEWLKDWISRNFILKIWQITSCSCCSCCSCRPNAERLGMSFSQCTVIRCCPLLQSQIGSVGPNLCVCFKLVKKGYKTNIPSFSFERIVEITHLRRTGNFSIFPRGFAPRKNRNMPVLLRCIIPTILSQSLVYLYTVHSDAYYRAHTGK